MAKIRVYELARELNIESKLLMNTLKTIGVSVASHQSTLADAEIDKVKKAMKGESVTPTPGQPVLAKRGGSVVVRRRRRDAEVEEKPEESEAAPNGADTTPAAQPVEAAQHTEDDSGAAAETHEPTERVVAEEQTTEALKSEGRPAAQDEQVQSPSTVSDESAERTVARRRSVGGATIVRKATPEEVEKSRQQAESKKRTRREDSKGTKYTGVGSDKGGGAPGAAGGPEVPVDVAASQAEESRVGAKRRGPLKDKRRGGADSEEEIAAAAKRLQQQKQKRGGLNVRMLLNQIDDEDVVETIETPYGTKQKTVYTPNIAQRRRDLKRRKDLKKTEITVAKAEKRVVRMSSEITVGEFAKQLKVKSGEVIKKLMDQGLMVTINQPIDFDTATLIATEYNFEVRSNVVSIQDILGKDREDWAAKGTETRPPIVTVMGHVDHGKTSILDAVRQADVAAGEAGGITQHIGAYAITHNDHKIAFLDTPGHEAFSSMRARGANATDIVVLVVAADDGVMPQTVEAISHAKDAGVPIIVAVNKMDKENRNVDRIYTELTEYGIQSEEWGGETQFVKVSALTKMGIDELLEAIILQAELLDLKTETNAPADGVVVEAHLDQGRGPVATVMIKHGTLSVGDYVVAGTEYGRVRAMQDHMGKNLGSATASTPVEIIGLSGVPEAGDVVHQVSDERTAREASEWRKENSVGVASKSSAQSLEDLLGKMKADQAEELPVIIKGDTQGSVEAISDSLAKVNTEQVHNKIIHKAVGGISESDITLAEASGAVIIGFNVRASRGLDEVAEKRGVLIKYFSVIYDLVDAVKNLMAGQLPPIREEVVIGKAEVRQPISVPRIGTIAGSAVIDGKITRSAILRLIRDDIVIYEGKIGSLRRFKDDVKEVKSGYECGIGFENYNDVKIGDVIEAYEIHESRPTL